MDLSKKLIGKTILSCETIKAEYGRTYDRYHCIVFTDGSKIILYGEEPYQPDPPFDEMRKAPTFYSSQDIAKKVEQDEDRRRRRIEEEKRNKLQEFERLKKELNQ